MDRSTSRAERSARALARDLLIRIERERAWATPLLARYERRLADPRDAALLHQIVLGVLQRRRLLDHVLEGFASRPVGEMDPEVRAALRIGVYSLFFLERVPDHAAVGESVALAGRGGAGFVNAVLRNVARRGSLALPPEPETSDVEGLALRHSFPTWWVSRLVSRIGWQRTVDLLLGLNRRTRTVLCPDPRRVDATELSRRLVEGGLRVERGQYAPHAVRIVGGNVHRTDALSLGLCWVQDEASQLVGGLLGPRVGPRAVDLCAAPGGKTLQLASRLDPGGLLVAMDRSAVRIPTLIENLARHGERSVTLVRGDASIPPFDPGGFDHVLLDAPCSGSGTLRRHPELRWRLEPSDLKLLAAEQGRLLRAAARLTASGGLLVYAVCSVEPEEGEDVVNRFVNDNADFDVADPRPDLSPPAGALVGRDGCLRTEGAADVMDGFFAARLRRRGSER